MVNSRRKGAVAEREIVKILRDELGIMVERNYSQANTGGADIVSVPGWSIEIKNKATGYEPHWMAQTIRQAREGTIPVLIYRLPNRPKRTRWRVEMRSGDALPDGFQDLVTGDFTIHMPLQLWIAIVRKRAKKKPQ